MVIVFLGNTKYSLIGATILNEKIGLSLIVTIPGSPLSNFATTNNIPLIETSKLDDSTIETIRKINPDFLIVEDYGLILPESLLDVPKYASINVHHSLLPKYRGPSPAPFAILNGEKVTGISIIKMAKKVDAGDIYEQKEYEMSEDETTDSLLTKLNELGGELAVKVINDIVRGTAKPTKQDEEKATYSKMLKKEDGFVDIAKPPSRQTLDRKVRAFYPWPGVWTRTIINNKSLIIKILPGNFVQVEGKKPQSFKDFKNGYKEGNEILSKLNL